MPCIARCAAAGLSRLSGLLFCVCSAVSQADPLTLDDLSAEWFDQTGKYLGIHMGPLEMDMGSGSGLPGNNLRSALGRINPTDDLPATGPGTDLPSKPAQILPDGSEAPVSTFGGHMALTDPEHSCSLLCWYIWRLDHSHFDQCTWGATSSGNCAGWLSHGQTG